MNPCLLFFYNLASGCAFKSLRTEMPKHMKDSPGIHLNLLCKTVSLQKQQISILSEVIEKQNREIKTSASKLQSLEMIFGPQFIWKIDNYAVSNIYSFKNIFCVGNIENKFTNYFSRLILRKRENNNYNFYFSRKNSVIQKVEKNQQFFLLHFLVSRKCYRLL